MKNNNQNKRIKRVFGAKTSVLVTALALILTATVGTTLALLIWRSEDNTSSFVPAQTECEVKETDGAYTVVNNGDTDAYVRAMFTVTWKNADGEIYGKKQPVLGADYALEINSKDWFLGDDGFYYCVEPVAAGEETPILVKNIMADPAEPYETAEEGEETSAPEFPADYRISVDMIAAAIQSEPVQAVEDYWNVKTNADGTIGK